VIFRDVVFKLLGTQLRRLVDRGNTCPASRRRESFTCTSEMSVAHDSAFGLATVDQLAS